MGSSTQIIENWLVSLVTLRPWNILEAFPNYQRKVERLQYHLNVKHTLQYSNAFKIEDPSVAQKYSTILLTKEKYNFKVRLNVKVPFSI